MGMVVGLMTERNNMNQRQSHNEEVETRDITPIKFSGGTLAVTT